MLYDLNIFTLWLVHVNNCKTLPAHLPEADCIRTLPRGGMYWEIHPPRPGRFPKGGDFAPQKIQNPNTQSSWPQRYEPYISRVDGAKLAQRYKPYIWRVDEPKDTTSTPKAVGPKGMSLISGE